MPWAARQLRGDDPPPGLPSGRRHCHQQLLETMMGAGLVERVRLHPYRLPLRSPWPSAAGRHADRRGWLLQLQADGVSGYGDCAPLPEAGTGSHAAAAAWWAQHLDELVQRPSDGPLDAPALLSSAPPAVACALEMALLDLSARLAGVPLRVRLAPNPRDRLPVNAMLGALDTTAAERAENAATAGFRVLKLKVGHRDPVATGRSLQALAGRLPAGVTLRLDANRAWADEDAIARFLEGLAGLPVEMVEEPLQRPTPQALQRLQLRSPVPLGLDESLVDLPHDELLSMLPAAWLVLKPMALGGLRPALALAQAGRAAGMRTLVTSVFESAAGLWATAQLAAALPAGGPFPAQGLATGAWLAENLGPPPPLHEGMMDLGAESGSGFVPESGA